jgi:hypothetical protein
MINLPRFCFKKFCLLKIKSDDLIIKQTIRYILSESQLNLNHFIEKRKKQEKLENSSTQAS